MTADPGEEEFFFFVFPNEDMERVSCTESEVWGHWNRTYPNAVRLTDVNGSVMAIRDTD